MRKKDFIIAYDLTTKSASRKLPKLLDRYGIRIQFSLYFAFQIDKKSLEDLICKIEEIIDKAQDDVRLYHIDKKLSISLRAAVDLNTAIIFKD